MKKIMFALIALALIMPAGCKKDKEKEGTKEDGPVGEKYARYQVWVRADQGLKKNLAILEKAEKVQLLAAPVEVPVEEKGRKVLIEVAKVKLADDKVGYIDVKHLADRPIVFTEDAKLLVRPTTGSKVFATVDRGTIGFIIAEKGGWVQVFVGKHKGKYLNQYWVNGGYTDDQKTLMDAKEYETALALFAAKKEDKGKKKLEELTGASPVIAELAKQKLEDLSKGVQPETPEKPAGPGREATPMDVPGGPKTPDSAGPGPQ